MVAPEGRQGTDATGDELPRMPDGERALAVEACGVSRSFRDIVALSRVDFDVRRGEIHALLGPYGAGKTTLLRLLMGLLEPTEGHVVFTGLDVPVTSRLAKRHIGFVPSGDRTFYNRLSTFENLVFFARLQGLRRREAAARSDEVLVAVGLADARNRRVGECSHGMQKRLAVARGLLLRPPLLFVDEATHDLDPEGARRVQALVADAAAQGTAVVWTTQRVDEIRGFADRVTVLGRGSVRFMGSVPQLMAVADAERFILRVRPAGADGGDVVPVAAAAVGGLGTVAPSALDDREHVVLVLAPGAVLGDAIAALARSGLSVLACREERSEVETAMLLLAGAREGDL